MNEIEQYSLFSIPPDWAEHWKSMPDFKQENLMPIQTVMVHFKSVEDRLLFSELVEQPITDETKYVWFPKPEIDAVAGLRYVTEEELLPKYPVYIISKGRWNSRLTSKALEELKVPYKIVVEPQEYKEYARHIAREKILQLPFSNLGQGSIPARNWVWEHSIKAGADRHWILDDNIRCFYRLHDNRKIRLATATFFRVMEDFVDRYTNVSIAGPNYSFFAKRKQLIPPFVWNTRIYSCILLDNKLSHRWRARYNEDTDLSIRILKDSNCSILFNAFLAGKMATMTMKGGNTDELYKEDGRLQMAESLAEQHPDIVRVTEKWGRAQHHVDYTVFKDNKPKLKPGVSLDSEKDYGFKIIKIQ